MEALVAAISSISISAVLTSVPPDACFANFRWEDCGKPPQPVMYYWKPGSRCEVGIWRGCLPSLNMFKDEYECVSTCIFTVRAQPSDWHAMNIPFEEYEDTTIGVDSDSGSLEYDGNSTTVATGGTGGTGGTDGTGATGADKEGGEAGDGEAEAPAGGEEPAAPEGGGEPEEPAAEGGEPEEPAAEGEPEEPPPEK